MPGVTLPNTGIVLPALNADEGAWDDLNNACWGNYDEHNHTSGKGLRVPVAGLNINADLPFSEYGITNLGRAAFGEIAALSSGARTLFVNEVDHELYWRTNAGTNVKLTNGASINTSLIGGIGGDYSSIGAEVAYDDANDAYTFKQEDPGGGRPWARVAAGDLRLYEFNTTESVFIALKAPAALGASYDITLPTAAPGATALLQMSSAGVVTASNTVANATTFSTSITTPTIAGTPNFTGAVTMASTLGVTGLITATVGLTAAANQDITVSGTGKYKHGSKRKPFVFVVAHAVSGGSWSVSASSDNLRAVVDAATTGFVKLDTTGLTTGNRLTRIFIAGSTSGTDSTFTLRSVRSDGSFAAHAVTASGSFATGTITLTLNTPATMNNDEVFYLKVLTGDATTDLTNGVAEFDQP